jgi:hypothetical protein
MIEQGNEILRGVPVAERPRCGYSPTKTSLVPYDKPELIPEFRNIRLEHAAVHQEAMTDDNDRCPRRAEFFVCETYPFSFKKRPTYPYFRITQWLSCEPLFADAMEGPCRTSC